ncbi:cystathionine beta-lyase [Polymorphobacter fuscus]|uniref:Cystathionine beta-lyase n=1 Tax=Sandarakinorhabdus fusca TaxID=1439888 RepID=A0A7C9KFZ6_9SPHN|nr:cystathionine beta-lyase [Polymorphobacter fuscus]KAB7648199.1 cystathionine beta-lyase [Polymorphobacter fuscus]MQT15700.1 cystathionine beta-lyase [Polymorphobacter fuscus]NJC08029.1 cystathionine beta-lyase [Polymorphobacter fuscus]
MTNRRQPPHDPGPVGIGTRLVAAGRGPGFSDGIVNPPVMRASTVLFDSLADLDRAIAAPDAGLYYGRRGTPTQWALEDALTGLEPGAAGTKLFPSGVAAITTALLAVVGAGDDVLITDSAYEPTRQFADQVLARFGVTTRYYDPCIGGDIAALIQPNTRAILLESPGSLSFEIQDVPAITAAARARGVVTMLDNTWGTALRLQPLALGCDISLSALTKYVGGHSDLLMGAATASEALWPRLKAATYRLGHHVSADDAALALRGLRTLEVRLDRAEASALAVARWLAWHPAVDRVLHPALPSHPGHELWKRDFTGASGLFCFVLKRGRRAHTAALIDGLVHFGIGFSWGGFESLVIPIHIAPIRTVTTVPWSGPMLRLSIGLEDPDDLIADLARGLERYEAQF